MDDMLDDLRDKDILILDSTGHSRNLLRQIPLLLGFTRVTCAGRTADALALLRENRFASCSAMKTFYRIRRRSS